jgi:hypothetical protein
MKEQLPDGFASPLTERDSVLIMGSGDGNKETEASEL